MPFQALKFKELLAVFHELIAPFDEQWLKLL